MSTLAAPATGAPARTLPTAAERATIAELTGAILTAVPAGVMTVAFLVGAAGLPIEPWTLLVLTGGAVVASAVGAYRLGRAGELRADWPDLAGWLLVVVGSAAYLLSLARPDYLPVSRSPDTVHHLSLIGVLQRDHALVRDPALGAYLGELVNYPPGAHLLAMLVSEWLRLEAVRLLQPLLCLLVALKLGLLYSLVTRLPPARQPGAPFGPVAPLLVLSAWGYSVQSFHNNWYFPQLASETFAVGMVWGLVFWNARPTQARLAFITLCALGVVLTWPVWLPITLLPVLGLALLRRDLPVAARLRQCLALLAPIALVSASYLLVRVKGDDSIWTHEGRVIEPSIDSLGPVLLALALPGLVAAGLSRPARPLLYCLAVALAQTGLMLWAYRQHWISQYLTFKVLHLHLLLLAALGALGLAALWRWTVGRTPLGSRRYARGLALVIPLAMLGLTSRRDLPTSPQTAFSAPVLEAGRWAGQELPGQCVDYLVDNWITAYWLHVNLLGNPRAQARTDAIVNSFRARSNSRERWANPDRLPFAIVGDLAAVPANVRSELTVLHRDGPAAVVRRSGGGPCGGTG